MLHISGHIDCSQLDSGHSSRTIKFPIVAVLMSNTFATKALSSAVPPVAQRSTREDSAAQYTTVQCDLPLP